MSSVDLSHQHAVQTLYEDHHSWLCSWLRRRLGCSDHSADLAQDTFIRVLTQRKTLELREPRAYLSTIARSLMIDSFRRRSLEQAYLETLALSPEPLAVSPETRALKSMRMTILVACGLLVGSIAALAPLRAAIGNVAGGMIAAELLVIAVLVPIYIVTKNRADNRYLDELGEASDRPAETAS